MIFFNLLEKYKYKGSFTYKPNQKLSLVCNAPADKAGVYLIYKVIDKEEILIYIGSSGQANKDGTLKIRKGGMKDRLVNGYHPNRFNEINRIPRKRAFPKQMIKVDISQIKIYWWVTYEECIHLDFPTDIEKKLQAKYLEFHSTMPEWHN